MGQSFKPVLVSNSKMTCYEPMEFGSGWKLMAQSWIGLRFVDGIAARIYNNPQQVWWVGEYADDLLENIRKSKIFNKAHGKGRLNKDLDDMLDIQHKFLVNHDKKQFVDIDAYIKRVFAEVKKGGDDTVPDLTDIANPLPLLTAIGNGYGSRAGDYTGINKLCVGMWAGNRLSYEDKEPEDCSEFEIVFVDEPYGMWATPSSPETAE